jgi:glycosyltransferase involved in cell wall biosynthesis
MMEILIVMSYYKPAYSYGGTVSAVSALAEGLAKQGANVTILTTNVNGKERLNMPLGQPVSLDGVEVYYYPLASISLGSFHYSPDLAQACKEKIKYFDLVVLETLWEYIAGPVVAASKRHHVPYIIQPHGQLLPWCINQKRLKKQLYLTLFGRRYLSQAAALHCTAPVEAEAIKSFNFRAPTFVVPNCIDLTRFENMPGHGHMRRRLGIPEDARVLLFMGRLHSVKRPDLAISTLIAAQSLTGEVHLIMAGPDETGMNEVLIELATQAGCANYLHIVGFLDGDDVLQAFTDSDILIMPSESENFGMSAVEAMASGVPVLVSDGVPVGHWAEEVGAGRVIPCNAEAFAEATVQLLSDAEHLKIMGLKGKKLARRFDNSVVAQQILVHYQSIIETGQPLK